MKKLLLLGGSRYLIPVIKRAKAMGIYTITSDYLPNNISHKYSDEYHNVSIVEKEKVLDLARELQVDGVMSFACDPGVVPAAFVAENLGLPSPGPYDSICILQNKGRFRKFLRDNGFNVPFSKSYSCLNDALAEANSFPYPLIVKPTDSAGSKGVSRVDNQIDLCKSIEYAISYSRSHEFIIEEFIESSGFSSDSDCFSIQGQLVFSSFSCQRFDINAINPYTPAAYSWPSSMPETVLAELRREIQRLLHLLNMQTSIYNVETRLGKNGKPYIMEVSPRAGGNRLAEMIHYATGTDLLVKSIQAALGDTVRTDDINEIQRGYWGEIILHSDTPGVFDSLQISDAVESNLFETDLWIKPGTGIGGFKAANEAIGTLVFRFDTEDQLKEVMDNSNKYIKVMVRDSTVS